MYNFKKKLFGGVLLISFFISIFYFILSSYYNKSISYRIDLQLENGDIEEVYNYYREFYKILSYYFNVDRFLDLEPKDVNRNVDISNFLTEDVLSDSTPLRNEFDNMFDMWQKKNLNQLQSYLQKELNIDEIIIQIEGNDKFVINFDLENREFKNEDLSKAIFLISDFYNNNDEWINDRFQFLIDSFELKFLTISSNSFNKQRNIEIINIFTEKVNNILKDNKDLFFISKFKTKMINTRDSAILTGYIIYGISLIVFNLVYVLILLNYRVVLNRLKNNLTFEE